MYSINLAFENARFRLATWRYQAVRRDQPVRVIVNGSPKTGTVWMVSLIASLPGQRAVGNFLGEIQQYNHLPAGAVVHAHDRLNDELQGILAANDLRVVLMLRDPRDQTVSRMFHIRRETTHSWHPRFKELSDDEALLLCIRGAEGLPSAATLTDLTQSWLDKGLTACLPVKYEDLQTSGEAILAEVFEHLGLSVPSSLVRAILEHNRFDRLTVGRRWWRKPRQAGQADPGSHYRKGIVGDWRNYFRAEHVEAFKEVAGQTLIDWGYEVDFRW